MKLIAHSQTSTVHALKFGDGYAISSHNLLGMWLVIHAGINFPGRQSYTETEK